MDLTVWLPALFVLGLVTLGLLTAFITACDKV
jgi:hypothetical protein